MIFRHCRPVRMHQRRNNATPPAYVKNLDEVRIAGPEPDEHVLALSEALEKLDATDKTAAELVKLRYFAGLTVPEAAAVLGVAPRTADFLWAYARAFLLRCLGGKDSGG